MLRSKSWWAGAHYKWRVSGILNLAARDWLRLQLQWGFLMTSITQFELRAGVCVLASCGMNSRIFPWFICFLSPLFWNLNAGDKRGPNDPFVWATTPASRQASLGNERLHLHIINGIHTSRHQSVQDDQELSGSYHRCMALVIYLCLLILTNAAGTGPGPANVAPAAHVTCHRPVARKVPRVILYCTMRADHHWCVWSEMSTYSL